MSKGLEALKELYLSARDDEFGYNGRSRKKQRAYEQRLYELKSGIEKELKVLEIIKELFEFEIEDYDENNHGSIKVKEQRFILDDEEIDLLKEALL